MPGSAMSRRTELDVRSSLKSQLGSTSSPRAGPTLVSKRTPSRISPPTATPDMPAMRGSPSRESITATSKVPPPKSTAISTPRCLDSPMTAAVGSGRNATSVKPALRAASSSLRKASLSEAWRSFGSAPAKTTGWPSTTAVPSSPAAESASCFRRFNTTLTRAPTLKSVAQLLVPTKPSFASSCFTPDSSRASLQPPPFRYWRQSVSHPYGASGHFQQSVFSCPDLRNVLTAWSRERPGCAERHDFDPVGVCDGDRAVAGAEVDPIADWTAGHPTDYKCREDGRIRNIGRHDRFA